MPRVSGILLMFVTWAPIVFGSQTDPMRSSGKYMVASTLAKQVSDTTFVSSSISDIDIDNAKFQNVRFENCYVHYRSYISYVHFDQVTFRNCTIPEIALSYGSLLGIRFINCNIGRLEIKDGNRVDQVSFKNCQIDEIDILRSQVT